VSGISLLSLSEPSKGLVVCAYPRCPMLHLWQGDQGPFGSAWRTVCASSKLLCQRAVEQEAHAAL